MSAPAGGRPVPGTRPLQAVVSYEPPDDWLCCWSYRILRDAPPRWELKFIHAGCRAHGKLQPA